MAERLDLTPYDETVAQVAWSVGRHYPGVVELLDLRQELYVWLLTHQEKVHQWSQEPLGDKRLAKSLRRVARAYSLNEKALRGGYDLSDVHFYSVGSLRELLVDAFFQDRWISGNTSLDPDKVKSHALVNEGMDRVAMLVDVMVGVRKLNEGDRALLYQTYGMDETTPAMVADVYQITPEALASRLARCLTRLQKTLGGPKPDTDWVGKRRVVSNATALAVTRTAYEEET